MIQKFLLALSFFTRIPIGKRDFGKTTLAQSVIAFPIVGALIGLLEGLFYIETIKIGIPSNVAVWLTIGFHLLLTGGLHEDGLADSADGLAAGRDREQRLAIMRDSRIGSYGVLALITALALRANIIAYLSINFNTIAIFIAASAASRSFLAILMYNLKPARDYGLAARAGKPAFSESMIAILFGGALLFITGRTFASLTAIIALVALYFIIKNISEKNLGGITGDILGATQQISEILLLLIFTFHLFT